VCTRIALVAFFIYTAASYFFGGEHPDARLALNVVRVVGLAVALWVLRGDGSRAETLTVAFFSLSITFGPAIAISVLRGDALPMVVLAITATSVMAILLPWGARIQAVYVFGVGAALGLVRAIAGPAPFGSASIDAAASTAIALLLSIGVAYLFERMRQAAADLVADAGQADEELARLHAGLEHRVRERTASLEFANRELEGFSYTLSHDLRSPLRTIAGFTDMIEEENAGRLSEASRDSLLRIRLAARRMDLLIDDMLLLARVGRRRLRLEPVDLTAMARSIAADLRAEQPQRQVEFEVDAVPTVVADYQLLHVAMENLLRNAWKFASPRDPARIRVTGEDQGGNVVCRISDNGIGFDPRFRSKLFRPFERIHDDPAFEGTGVGLATVARVIHRHGGEVDATGSPGGGATFSFSLPKDGGPARRADDESD
jgi:signal transduction histidine kinase